MQTVWRWWRMSTAALIGGLLVQNSLLAACPFCPPSTPPLAEQVASADLALLARWVSSQSEVSDSSAASAPAAVTDDAEEDVAPPPPGGDGDTSVAADDGSDVGSATTKFEVVEVMKSLVEQTPREVTVPYLLQGRAGDLFLLLGNRTQETDEWTWSQVLEVSEVSYQYIRQAPSPEQSPGKRLSYFLRFLEYSDPLIANDAFSEFSRAAYADVAALAGVLPRQKLRGWLRAADVPERQVRSGFYGMLLGLCGDQSDIQLLESRVMLVPRPDEVRLGIDGWMGGLLLLDGGSALDRLVAAKLDAPGIPDGEAHALLGALRFVAEYAPERVPRPKLLAAARRLLDRPALAELVVVDLARWKDWSVLPTLAERYGQDPFDSRSGRDAIVKFAEACLKTAQREPVPEEFLSVARAIVQRSTKATSPGSTTSGSPR